jgi:ubiquinone/menaquinone biosynthesis C-methylase UbiE
MIKTKRSSLAMAAALMFIATAAHSQTHSGGMHGHHRFDDPQKWSQQFDSAARDAWQMPDRVVQSLDLKPDATVADIGAGTGYFSVRLARVAPQGRVFAIDIEPTMLAHITARAENEGLKNITVVRGTETSAAIPEKVDLVLIVDTYHHISARTAYMAAIKSQLKQGGRVAIIDFKPDATEGAPKHMRLSTNTVVAEMTAAGFAQLGSHEFLPHQYFVIFRVK